MKIAEVKKLDDGVSGIIIEGKITKILLKPRENEHGWSQFVQVQDDTDKIACWVNIETAEDAYKVGQYIHIKGKVSKYTKGNKPQVSFSGNVIEEIVKDEDVSQVKPMESEKKSEETIHKSEKVDPKVWEAKDLRMARESALKNIAQYVVAGIVKLGNRFDYAHEDVDFIYNGLEKNITSEAITKEFGGTVVEEKPENPYLPEGYKEQVEEGQKEQKIAQARELVKNPHLTEPVNDKMATIKQKKQIYGYINKEGKKIGGMVDSQYIKKDEVKNIGKAQDMTKANAIKYWEYWYGKEEEVGERDKREIVAKEKEGNPLLTERQPIEKRDQNGNSLTKDVLIDDIQELRKKNHLQDDKKFSEALGCNAKFELWTEKELTELKKKLGTYKPNWVTGK